MSCEVALNIGGKFEGAIMTDLKALMGERYQGRCQVLLSRILELRWWSKVQRYSAILCDALAGR